MSKPSKKNNVLSYVLPFGLSAILLAIVFRNIDFKHILEVVKGADMGYLALAGFVYFAVNFVIWYRWMIFMKMLNLKFKRFSSLRWFFIGLFCSLLPLTSVGGDVVKGLGLSHETGNKPRVFASIVLDRMIGFVGIVLIAFLAFMGGRHIVDDPSIIIAILGMTLFLVCLGVVLFSHRVFSWATHVFSRWPKLKESLMSLHYDVVLLKGKYDKVAITLLISLFGQFVLAFDYYLIAKALHQDIPLFYFVIFSPLICVAQTLPSIGGLGIRELGWATLLAKVGTAQSVAVALGLINFAFMLIVGILGGLFYVATLSVRRVQHHQASPAIS